MAVNDVIEPNGNTHRRAGVFTRQLPVRIDIGIRQQLCRNTLEREHRTQQRSGVRACHFPVAVDVACPAALGALRFRRRFIFQICIAADVTCMPQAAGRRLRGDYSFIFIAAGLRYAAAAQDASFGMGAFAGGGVYLGRTVIARLLQIRPAKRTFLFLDGGLYHIAPRGAI